MKTISWRFIRAFVAIVLMIYCHSLGAQTKEKDYYKMDYDSWMLFIPGNDSISPFFISAKPVTNKEYILYLVWTERVYRDYPKVLFDALPGIQRPFYRIEYSAIGKDSISGHQFIIPEYFIPFSDSLSFKYYLENAESFVSNYMFNPDYLNYPVIGIDWEQANKFCHWLSDRYNEYTLIKKKYLMFESNQKDEDNFSTESFIFGQYIGTVNKPLQFFGDPKTAKGFEYVSYQLKPSFHLVTKKELELCSTLNLPTVTKKIYNIFKPYAEDCSEFLKLFYEYYLPKHKGYIYVNPDPYGSENKSYYLASEKIPSKPQLPKVFNEWCLDSYLESNENSAVSVYQKYGSSSVNFNSLLAERENGYFPAKDSLGVFRYMIIGENKQKEIEIFKAPINLKKSIKIDTPYIYDYTSGTIVNKEGDIYTCFRVAVGAIKK